MVLLKAAVIVWTHFKHSITILLIVHVLFYSLLYTRNMCFCTFTAVSVKQDLFSSSPIKTCDRSPSFRRCSTAPQLIDSPPVSPISHCYYSSHSMCCCFCCQITVPRTVLLTWKHDSGVFYDVMSTNKCQSTDRKRHSSVYLVTFHGCSENIASTNLWYVRLVTNTSTCTLVHLSVSYFRWWNRWTANAAFTSESTWHTWFQCWHVCVPPYVSV